MSTTVAGAPATTGQATGRGGPWATLVAVALGVVMVALDGTIVAIANPAIGKSLDASLPDLQWITNGYLLALAVFLVTAGKLGDRFGHKSTYLTGVIGFAATSAVIGLSHNIGLIIAFRVLQGVFGALLQPAALGLLRSAFPANRLNIAIGIWGAAIGVSTAAGPIVGGLLVEHVSWQSVFFINVPVGVVALAVGLLVLPRNRAVDRDSRTDVPGIALLSVAMFALVFGVIKASDFGWSSWRTIGLFAGALAFGVLFVIRERYAAHPLLPLSLFRSVPLSIGTALMMLMAFAMFGALFFVTFYLQLVDGLSPVESGVRILPMTAGMVFGSPIAGILIGKVGPRFPVAAGMAGVAVALFGLSRLPLDAGAGTTSIWFVLLGLGLSVVMVGATEVIVGNAPVELSGVASGLQQSAMQVGGALGTAVLGALMTARVGNVLNGHWTDQHLPKLTPDQVDQAKKAVAGGVAPIPEHADAGLAAAITKATNLSFLDGMHLAFTVAAAVGVVAVVLALFVSRPKNPATTHTPHI
ncbi:MFS transporter [Actinocatenispora rupis]|uniref:MFS transporter n=1 Tax=Actinocatenispora rupis TaxID=519421 RepID=A0A8J3NE99_9ACTN|nr:MFS transporter [Actinocatenispora rupis]GID13837.1 MFS transporter [Actinocatenispora rupis]